MSRSRAPRGRPTSRAAPIGKVELRYCVPDALNLSNDPALKAAADALIAAGPDAGGGGRRGSRRLPRRSAAAAARAAPLNAPASAPAAGLGGRQAGAQAARQGEGVVGGRRAQRRRRAAEAAEGRAAAVEHGRRADRPHVGCARPAGTLSVCMRNNVAIRHSSLLDAEFLAPAGRRVDLARDLPFMVLRNGASLVAGNCNTARPTRIRDHGRGTSMLALFSAPSSFFTISQAAADDAGAEPQRTASFSIELDTLDGLTIKLQR